MTGRRATIAFLLFASLLASSCYTIPFRDPGPGRPFVPPAEPLALFEYDRGEFQVKWYPQDEVTERYALHRLKFVTRDFEGLTKEDVKMFFFAPRDPAARAPLLVVMPPTGGPKEIPLAFGRDFAGRGWAVLCMMRRERFFKPGTSIEYHRDLFRQAVVDIRRAIDWAAEQPGVDGNRVGILGISLGAILAQLAMQADPRIGSGVLLLGAQDLPMVLDTSGYVVVRRYRKSLRRQLHVDEEGLRRVARERFVDVDPMSYPGRIDPARILMVSARFDNIIRYPVTLRTWENLGHPELFVVPAGHYSSMLFKGLSMGKIRAHLARTLNVPEDPSHSKGGDSHAFVP